jgi:hypothetical protein
MHEIPYHDELLADRTVHRRYADGREEWRARSPSGVVTWRDNQGGAGTDEQLGKRIIKRRSATAAWCTGGTSAMAGRCGATVS